MVNIASDPLKIDPHVSYIVSVELSNRIFLRTKARYALAVVTTGRLDG